MARAMNACAAHAAAPAETYGSTTAGRSPATPTRSQSVTGSTAPASIACRTTPLANRRATPGEATKPVDDAIECSRVDSVERLPQPLSAEEDRGRDLGGLDDPLVAVGDRSPRRAMRRVGRVAQPAREQRGHVMRRLPMA